MHGVLTCCVVGSRNKVGDGQQMLHLLIGYAISFLTLAKLHGTVLGCDPDVAIFVVVGDFVADGDRDGAGVGDAQRVISHCEQPFSDRILERVTTVECDFILTCFCGRRIEVFVILIRKSQLHFSCPQEVVQLVHPDPIGFFCGCGKGEFHLDVPWFDTGRKIGGPIEPTYFLFINIVPRHLSASDLQDFQSLDFILEVFTVVDNVYHPILPSILFSKQFQHYWHCVRVWQQDGQLPYDP